MLEECCCDSFMLEARCYGGVLNSDEDKERLRLCSITMVICHIRQEGQLL